MFAICSILWVANHPEVEGIRPNLPDLPYSYPSTTNSRPADQDVPDPRPKFAPIPACPLRRPLESARLAPQNLRPKPAPEIPAPIKTPESDKERPQEKSPHSRAPLQRTGRARPRPNPKIKPTSPSPPALSYPPAPSPPSPQGAPRNQNQPVAPNPLQSHHTGHTENGRTDFSRHPPLHAKQTKPRK